jgi:hypothetical protein
VGNGPGIPELLTVKDQPKENNQFYRTDVALSQGLPQYKSFTNTFTNKKHAQYIPVFTEQR